MKGIVLAGGKGTRLYPMTKPCYKPLLPIYDKPMIYYPLSTLLLAGIRDILIIVPPDGISPFAALLGDGSRLGIRITYKEQKIQRGIADAFIVGQDFIGDDSVCLVLGDNIFYGNSLPYVLQQAADSPKKATVLGYYVNDPQRFGVVEIDSSGCAISIEEKPQKPKSNYIIPGLYFYDNSVVKIAQQIQPSARGELEITDVNNVYLREKELQVLKLDQSIIWFDTGTADSMFDAAEKIRHIQKTCGINISCLEQIAYEKGFISKDMLLNSAKEMAMTDYGQYLLQFARQL